MNHPQSAERIVVGIDGSDAAIRAAKWAVAEAISRDIPLRLIHAIPERRSPENSGDETLDVLYGETALRLASAALHAMDQPAKIEAELVQGPHDSALIKESDYAAMICIGSVGIGSIARKVLGSTAESVAKNAHCPVAVIRSDHQINEPPSGWVAVVVDDSPGNDAVLEHGFREARLRHAPILALGVWRWGLGEIPYQQLDHRLGHWAAQYPEVHVQPAAARSGAAKFISHTQESVQFAVVGSEDADKVARIVGPHHPHFGNAGCSVLVVRK
jgi:nucleotide-binding universal stress UspA family protein